MARPKKKDEDAKKRKPSDSPLYRPKQALAAMGGAFPDRSELKPGPLYRPKEALATVGELFPSREAVKSVATQERGGPTPGARPGNLAPDIGPDAMGLDRAFTPEGIAEQYSAFPKPVEGWQPRPGAALGGAPPQRASAGAEISNAQVAAVAAAARDAHGTTPATSVELNDRAGREAAASRRLEDEVYQSELGGTAPGDHGRTSSIVLPTGKKVWGNTPHLAGQVGGEGPARTAWGSKPGRGDERPSIQGSGATVIAPHGGAPAGAGLDRAIEAAGTSGRPYSEALRANINSIIGPVSSDPIQVADQIRHRQMLEEKVRMEQGRELGDVQHDTQIAQNLQAQSMAAEDPLARERIRAQGQYGDAYLKTKAEADRDAELKQKLAPIFAAMTAATSPEDQQRLFQMAQLMIAMYGRTAPSQSNQGLGFFGFQPTGGAPAAEAAK